MHGCKKEIVDEDSEIILINSQQDYTEALENEDLSSLKMIVADNSADARRQFEINISDVHSIAESLNASAFMQVPPMSARTQKAALVESSFEELNISSQNCKVP